VAVGCHGDLDEEVVWAEAGRVWGLDLFDLVGLVVFDDLALYVSAWQLRSG
jgi:hypothetical protein